MDSDSYPAVNNSRNNNYYSLNDNSSNIYALWI